MSTGRAVAPNEDHRYPRIFLQAGDRAGMLDDPELARAIAVELVKVRLDAGDVELPHQLEKPLMVVWPFMSATSFSFATTKSWLRQCVPERRSRA